MTTKERLEELRTELRAERISYSELAELQALYGHIEPEDVELLEAAGVPEFSEMSEREQALAAAARKALDALENMTSEEFARGADADVRIALAAALGYQGSGEDCK
jgi:hypothetical protein